MTTTLPVDDNLELALRHLRRQAASDLRTLRRRRGHPTASQRHRQKRFLNRRDRLRFEAKRLKRQSAAVRRQVAEERHALFDAWLRRSGGLLCFEVPE